jgi:hypothetical protein
MLTKNRNAGGFHAVAQISHRPARAAYPSISRNVLGGSYEITKKLPERGAVNLNIG